MDALILRGVFLFGPDEVDYLFANGGAAGQNPEAWDSYCSYIRDTSDDWEREELNLLGAYWERLTSKDKSRREAAASAFVGYELSISKTYVDPKFIEECLGTPSLLIPFAVMEVRRQRAEQQNAISNNFLADAMPLTSDFHSIARSITC